MAYDYISPLAKKMTGKGKAKNRNQSIMDYIAEVQAGRMKPASYYGEDPLAFARKQVAPVPKAGEGEKEYMIRMYKSVKAGKEYQDKIAADFAKAQAKAIASATLKNKPNPIKSKGAKRIEEEKLIKANALLPTSLGRNFLKLNAQDPKTAAAVRDLPGISHWEKQAAGDVEPPSTGDWVKDVDRELQMASINEDKPKTPGYSTGQAWAGVRPAVQKFLQPFLNVGNSSAAGFQSALSSLALGGGDTEILKGKKAGRIYATARNAETEDPAQAAALAALNSGKRFETDAEADAAVNSILKYLVDSDNVTMRGESKKNPAL